MAKSILLVKTSSLGDVIHALPAVSDMRAAVPGLQVDWLVEESLVAIPRLHAGVASIIPVALRRWRRSFWQAATRREMSAFAARLRTHSYDAVIDAQGLFKSAVIALFTRGPRYGLDFHSAREPLALFYQQTFRVGWDIHAVERNRLLAARVLGYANARPCNYGISAAARAFASSHSAHVSHSSRHQVSEEQHTQHHTQQQHSTSWGGKPIDHLLQNGSSDTL